MGLGQRRQHGGAVGATGAQAPGLRLGLGCGARRTGAPVAIGAGSAGLTRPTALTATVVATAIGATAVVAAPATGSIATGAITARAITAGPAIVASAAVATGAITTITAVAAVTSTSAPTTLGCQHRRHAGLVASRRTQDLEALGLGSRALGRQDRHDRDALDGEVGVGPHHVAHGGTAVEQAAVQLALGLTGTGGAPRPRSIGAGTRELDVKPA
jgi:hypothetical protein